MMKKSSVSAAVLIVTAATSLAFGQEAPAGKTLAATMNVYAFPNKGQTPSQQSQDESACYQYAVTNVGTDPFQLQQQAQHQQQQTEAQKQQIAAAGQGAGVKGAAAGAATGALFGAVTDGNSSASAGWGAAAGAVTARRGAKRKQAAANEQVDQQAQQAAQATQAQLDNFKKAFSVCLESKNYMVKY